VWRKVVVQAREAGPACVVGAVGLALPALRQIAGRLTRDYHAADACDLDTEVLTGFLYALRSFDVAAPHLRPRLCQAARLAGQRARQNAETAVCRRLPARSSAPPPPPWNHPDFVLGDAVAKGVVSQLDAELIGRTRLEKAPLAQAAAELGLSMEAAKKRRQRAEPVLCAAIQSGFVHSPMSPTISPPALEGMGALLSVRDRDTSDTQPDTTHAEGDRGAVNPGPARTTPRNQPPDATDVRPDLHDLEVGRRNLNSSPPAPLPTIAASRLYPCGLPPRGRPRPWRWWSRRACYLVARRWLRRALAIAVMVLIVFWALGGCAYASALADPKNLEQVIDNLRSWLIGFLAALATLMATIGGLRYLLAGGDPGEVAKAKNTLKYAAFGYAIAALAPLLVATVKSIVGA
jgi:hypothetical protein